MEEVLKFENRQNLFQFLIDKYNFKVINEKDYGEMGYYVDLSNHFFLLRYVNDRLILSIDIASHFNDEKHFFALSFVKDLLYNPNAINMNQGPDDNLERVNELNQFLRTDYDKICVLFNKENYTETKRKIDNGLEKAIAIKFPFAKKYD